VLAHLAESEIFELSSGFKITFNWIAYIASSKNKRVSV
jgi:hypothetical protein